MKILPLTDTQLAMIRRAAILTGSRAYGGCHEKSDYDYMLMADDYEDLSVSIDQIEPTKNGSWDGNEDHRSYVVYKASGDKINLLVFKSPITYAIWLNATAVLSELFNYNSIISVGLMNKSLRIDLFRALRLAQFTDDSSLTSQCKTMDDIPGIIKKLK